jgi:molecular chaperone GrpE
MYGHDWDDGPFGRPRYRRSPVAPRRPRLVPVDDVMTARAPEPECEPEAVDKDRLRAALRDLEAARERVERGAEQTAAATRAGLIERLLPVLDNLDRSLAASEGSPDESLRDGVQLVRDQFEQVLRGYGLARFDTVGCAFDPNEHDAVAVVPVDDPRKHNVVVDEWEPGYRLGDRVLRAAKVRVGKLAA